jgi:methyl-accepting chemotaxis protein
MFMATALHADHGRGRLLGVLALQLPTDRILEIMNYTSGMGDTGETYLVGPDKLMRSNSRFIEESTVLRQSVDTPAVERALAGEQGMTYLVDYRGVEVMSVYLPMELAGANWAVLAELDREEIARIAARERPSMAGVLLFLYGLSLWSVWYWRSRPLDGEGEQLAGLDFGDNDGGGMADG